MDLDGNEFLVCPHCGYIYDKQVDDIKENCEDGYENADAITCIECDEPFIIVRINGIFIVEEGEEEEI